jgi:hypothetical protein
MKKYLLAAASRYALAVAPLLSLALLALLELAPMAQAAMPFCRADVARLCPGVEPGNNRVVNCLRAHKMELSGGCVKELLEFQVGRNCGVDLEHFCGNVIAGKARLAAAML